ncbi:MAG: nucleoside deaminase [Candidatus Binatia bacterium]
MSGAMTDGTLVREALAAVRAGLAAGGGPFGALVVDPDGHVVAVRTNAVLLLHDPTAHAEVLAIRAASARAGTYHLRGYTLVTTCAPCVMCAGAIHWAGFARVVASARREDAEAIGFIEGPHDFHAGAFLAARGIAYICDVERESAVALLRAYTGEIYNG